MTVSKHQLLVTLAALERQAPLYFDDMPLADDQIRDLFAEAMAGLLDAPDFRDATPRGRELSLLAALTHALIETAALRHRLSQQDQAAAGAAVRLIAKVATH